MINVLVISITFIPSVLLCGHSQLEYLENIGKIKYRFAVAHFTNEKDIEWADIIVFIRSDSDIEAHISKIAKKKCIHSVYVLDDDLLNVPNYISSYPYYSLPSTKNNMKVIIKNCDTFLTPSPVLLEKYGEIFKNKYLISEPSLNRIIKKEENKKVKIGFAGSVDRTQDLNELLEDAITKIVNKYGDSIDIEFFGAKPEFVDKLNLKHIPYQEGYDAYTASMAKANWDIGLAPMPKTDFHRCKYFNKYVEYASFGIVGVYSNLEPYTYGIKDRVNGLLVNNTTDEWYNAISELIENEKLRKEISSNCLKEANNNYPLDLLANDYLNKILVDYKEKNIKSRVSSFIPVKFIIFWKRVYRKIQEQGSNFPTWLNKKIDKKINDKKKEKRHLNNKKQLFEKVKNKKSICIFAPYYDDGSDYSKRVKLVDDELKDVNKIYLNGENRLCEYIEVDYIDNLHVLVTFNSYDINQVREVFNLIKLCKNCLIHSVIRFMRERLSIDMYKLFDLDDVCIIWDTHGDIPGKYRDALNFHMQEITNKIESVFIDNNNYVLVDSNELKNHFHTKYNRINGEILIVNEKNNGINNLLR